MKKEDWLYFSAHIHPILIICAYYFNMPYTFMGLFLFLIALFIALDFFIQRDKSYPYEQVIATVENDGRFSPWLYQFATASYFFVYLVALCMGLYYVQFKEPFLAWLSYSFFLGYCGSITMDQCHEYFHHTNPIEQFISRFFLSLSFSNSYEYEHLFNHHDEHTICTEKDCSYAKLNESCYEFMYKYVTYSGSKAIEVQKRLCEQGGYSFYNIFKNTLLKWTIISFLIPIVILIFIGWKALLFYLIQGQISIFFNLLGSYHQHYGLSRRMKPDGTIEPFTFMNTWGIDHFFSGKADFNMFHHGHHHLFSFCRYPHLKLVEYGPLMKYGFHATIFLSLFPKLWFKNINPKVEEVFKLRDQLEKEGKL